MHYLWRAVDHEGKVLECFITKNRDRAAALKFIKNAMKRHGRPKLRFRQMTTSHKFSSVHTAFHNHFNQDRHLISRDDFKARRAAAFAEWKTLAA